MKVNFYIPKKVMSSQECEELAEKYFISAMFIGGIIALGFGFVIAYFID